MFEGIRIENNGNNLDLQSLPTNENGELIVEDISSLKIFIESGASYDENNVQIMENNSDIKISLTDASGNDIFIVLKNLNDILLANNSEVPVFEVFKIGEDGIETLASFTTIEDLQAAAAGAETLTSETTPDTGTGAAGEQEDPAPADDGNPDGIGTTGPGGPNTPTFAFDITFSGDLTGTAIEDVSDSSGLLTNDDPHYGPQAYIPTTIVGTFGTFTIDAIGNWTYILDDANPNVQALALDETLSESFTVFTEGLNGSALLTLTILGTNDQPIVSDVVDENFCN